MYKTILTILLFSSLSASEVMECINMENHSLRINLTVYPDKINDGKFNYYLFKTENGNFPIKYYKDSNNNYILMSVKYVNGTKTYPAQFVIGKTKITLVCMNKKALIRKRNENR